MAYGGLYLQLPVVVFELLFHKIRRFGVIVGSGKSGATSKTQAICQFVYPTSGKYLKRHFHTSIPVPSVADNRIDMSYECTTISLEDCTYQST